MNLISAHIDFDLRTEGSTQSMAIWVVKFTREDYKVRYTIQTQNPSIRDRVHRNENFVEIIPV